VTAFVVTPSTLGSGGGPVTLSANVTNATSCVFSSIPIITGLPATVPCASGSVSQGVTVPADKATKAAKYKFGLSVMGTKMVKAKAIKLTVPAAAAPATLTSVSPATGSEAGQTTVTLKGKNLAGATAVDFGLVPGTQVTDASATSVTAVSPAGTGKVNVTVTTPAGDSPVTPKATFTYVPAPIVTGVSPGAGPHAGGTSVTITGSNLSGAPSVKFGTKAATVTADSTTSITATSPAESVGTVNVTVTTADGTSAISSADKFAYTSVITSCTGSIASDSELPAGSYVNCGFDVPSGVTLAIDPGAVLKSGTGPPISVEGTLDAIGTPTDPVTFTSMNDNSIGGNTGNGSPAGGDFYGIIVDGSGSLNLQYATIDYARTGVTATGAGSIDQENSLIENSNTGVSANTTGSVRLINNALTSIYFAGFLIFAAAPTVEGNTATNVGQLPNGSFLTYPAYFVDASALNPALVGGNSASGGWPVFGLNGTVAVSGTLPAEEAPWLLYGPSDAWGVTSTSLDVPSGITLTVAPGAVIKGDAVGNGGPAPDPIFVEGTLDAIGTPTDPVTFTSMNDNSIGGNTGNGSPAGGDFYGIIVDGSGSLNLQYATIDYARTGVTFSGSGSLDVHSTTIDDAGTGVSFAGSAGIIGGSITDSGVAIASTTGALSFRGNLENDQMGVESCNWGGTCTVDAAYSYWGSANGPSPSGGAPLACGAVTVSPWLTSSGGSFTTNDSDSIGIGDCGGSPSQSPDQVLSAAESSYGIAIGNEQIDCGNGFQDACQVIEQSQACLSAAWGLAGGSSPFTLPAVGGDIVSAGSSWLESSESAVVSDIGSVLGFSGDVVGLVVTTLGIASAYNQCVP
jgi:hypothetical protein